MILASHVLHEVESVTQQFLLIHGGRILASGDANEVQAMIVDFPQEIILKGHGLSELAAAIAGKDWVSSTRFTLDPKDIDPWVFANRKLSMSFSQAHPKLANSESMGSKPQTAIWLPLLIPSCESIEVKSNDPRYSQCLCI